MTYVSTGGQLSMYTIAVYLGITHVNCNMNMSQFRTLAGKPSGQISIADFYNKCTCHTYTPCSCDGHCNCNNYT